MTTKAQKTILFETAIEAIVVGNNELTISLIHKIGNINKKDECGYSMLELAASKNRLPVVDLLLGRKDIDIGTDGEIHRFIANKDAGYRGEKEEGASDDDGVTIEDLSKKILEKDPNFWNDEQKVTLFLVHAVRHGHVAATRAMLEFVNKTNCFDSGYNLVTIAARHKHYRTLKLLLSFGYKPEVKSENHTDVSSLEVAVASGCKKCVKLLCKPKYMLTGKDANYRVLIAAIDKNNEDMLKFLWRKGIAVDASQRNNILRSAVYKGADACIPFLKERLEGPLEPNHPDKKSLLHIAIDQKHLDTFYVVLDEFPNLLEEVDAKGVSPLCYAVRAKFVEMVEALLLAGADAYFETTDSGKVPIYFAMETSFKVIVFDNKLYFNPLEPENNVTVLSKIWTAANRSYKRHRDSLECYDEEAEIPSSYLEHPPYDDCDRYLARQVVSRKKDERYFYLLSTMSIGRYSKYISFLQLK